MFQLTTGQKVVLFLGLVVAALAIAYPPFISGGDLIPTVNYAPLWQPPIVDREYGTPTVFTSLLLVEFVVLSVIITLIMISLRPDPDRGKMSNTRWNLLLWNLSDIPIRIRFKYMDSDPVFEGGLSPMPDGSAEGPDGPILRQSLEWMEIDPIQQSELNASESVDHTNAVKAVLQTLNVPYERDEAWLRIIGNLPTP